MAERLWAVPRVGAMFHQDRSQVRMANEDADEIGSAIAAEADDSNARAGSD